ncbi:MAG: hypothetical protein EAZ39_04135 [Oscillatoriales cyanobacterium]|nr:MAG: hypothetical protein EAZ39_04135 [Oscillatoriales cyanobacterium]TAG37829.1 MAG: hypothetical protein EAZ33_21025 [Oscillatoriales cyanobacterium]
MMEFELKFPAVGNRVYTNHVRLRGRRNMEFEKSRRLETAPTQTMSASADEEIWNLREMCD